jgi:tRNA pseudouridine55 synthase
MDGLLIIDKPSGCTSHDVVLTVRKLLGAKRVGHGGTLDPDATGVLLVAIGRATRFFPLMSGLDKTYVGSIQLGYSTDTYDASGRPTSVESKGVLPAAADVAAAMKTLEGGILQVPPPYSAKKLGGRPAYQLARARKEFVLEPARVNVHFFRMGSYEPPWIEFEVKCSSGTYVRSLAHDLGQRLGCGGHLRSLRRTSVGSYTVSGAVSLADVEKAAAEGRVHELVIPLEGLLPELPAVILAPEAVARVMSGSPLLPHHLTPPSADQLVRGGASLFRILGPSGRLLGLARPSSSRDMLRPFLVVK